MVRFKQI